MGGWSSWWEIWRWRKLRRYFCSNTVYSISGTGTLQLWSMTVMNLTQFNTEWWWAVTGGFGGGGVEADHPSTWPELDMKVRNSGIKLGDNDRFIKIHGVSWTSRLCGIHTVRHVPKNWLWNIVCEEEHNIEWNTWIYSIAWETFCIPKKMWERLGAFIGHKDC
jgi:hypothetical protein